MTIFEQRNFQAIEPGFKGEMNIKIPVPLHVP